MRFGKRTSMLCGLAELVALAATGTAYAADRARPSDAVAPSSPAQVGPAAPELAVAELAAPELTAPEPASSGLALPASALAAEPCTSTRAGAASARKICQCVSQSTDPVTRAGVTCQKARQRAKDAARALAVCPPSSEGSCGPVSHSIMPCVDRPGGGFTATAVAFYSCEYCIYIDG